MPLRQEIYQEINELVATGKTEQALVKLRRSLETDAPSERQAIQHALLLSGQYHTWEESMLSGVKDDSKELARINRELLRLVDNLSNPNSQAHAYTPPTTTSPDPLKPVYIQVQAPQQPSQPPAKKENKIVKYLTGFFIVMGVLFVIDAVLPDEEVPAGTNPVMETPLITEPNTAVGQPVEPVPAPTLDLPPAVDNNFQPRVSQLLSSQIKEKMLDLVESGADPDPSVLTALSPNEVSRQFGNSVWYHQNLGSVTFTPNGQYASYLNGTGALQIFYCTTYGFYIGTYAESSTGDTGYMSIVPPNNSRELTIYVESINLGTENLLELIRQ